MKIKYQDICYIENQQRKKVLKLRKEINELPHRIEGNFIACLGRQLDSSNKFNQAYKPLWGGIYIKYNDLEILIDPGINIFSRSIKLGLNLIQVNNLFISHAHIDHHNDANVILEMVAHRSPDKPIKILLSEESFNENIIKKYYTTPSIKNPLVSVNYLNNKRKINLTSESSLVPIEVCHSIKGSYGFILNLGKIKVGYTGDTGFSETIVNSDKGEIYIKSLEKELVSQKHKLDDTKPKKVNRSLIEKFQNVDILIFDLHDVSYRKHSLYHSTVPDLIYLLKDSKIKFCICEHFNPFDSRHGDYIAKVENYLRAETNKEIQIVRNSGYIYKL